MTAKSKSMDVLRRKMARHPRREIKGRSFEGTPCLELMRRDGSRPVSLKDTGYAYVRDGQNGKVGAHRAALAIATGRNVWAETLEVDHLCWTRNCVNPAHLRWVTRVENCAEEAMSPEGVARRRAAGRAKAKSGQLAAASRVNARKARISVVSAHLDSGKIQWHRDMNAAARALGVNQGSISACISGRIRRTGRYSFARFDESNPDHTALLGFVTSFGHPPDDE